MAGHSHSHCHGISTQGRSAAGLAISLGLTSVFVVFEAASGVWANSLALLSDAGHNLTDVIALGLTWYAVRLSAQPATSKKTFGYHRAGILAALVNATTLAVVSLWIFYDASRRFFSPPEVKSGILIGVGLIALLINASTAALVFRGSKEDLAMRSVFVHLLGDVASSFGAVAAGLLIAWTHQAWIDALVSVFISVLILWNAWGILRETVEILLEGTPRDIDVDRMVQDVLEVDGVRGVHDLHVWSVTQSLRALCAHIVTDDISISAGAVIQNEINELMLHKYAIGHATLQLESVDCEKVSLFCDMQHEHHHHSHDEG